MVPCKGTQFDATLLKSAQPAVPEDGLSSEERDIIYLEAIQKDSFMRTDLIWCIPNT